MKESQKHRAWNKYKETERVSTLEVRQLESVRGSPVTTHMSLGLYWGTAPKLGLLSQHYHLPSWRTGT